MSQSLLVTNIKQLITLTGPARPRVRGELQELGIMEDAWLLIEDGKVAATGTQSPPTADHTIDAQSKVILPGWVDAHTHAVFGGNRVDEYELRAQGASYQEIAAKGGGIRSTVAKTRAASEDELYEAGRRYGRWFLQTGTTTVEAKSGYGLTLHDELKILRTIQKLDRETPLRYVPTFLGAHATPAGMEQEEYLQSVIQEMLPAVAKAGLARYCDIFCERSYFTPDCARRLMTAAKTLGLGVRMHVDQLTDGGGAALAAELGAATADHLEQTGADGIAALGKAGVQSVLLPGSVFALGLKKYPDARAMVEAGLAVVLATDFNPGSSPGASMPMTLSLACTQMGMTPAEAVTAATINAAYSLGLGEQVGSLEAGKIADFVIYDVADYREIPYFFGVNHVETVFVGGVKVIESLSR